MGRKEKPEAPRFEAQQRPDGEWEVIDRYTGVSIKRTPFEDVARTTADLYQGAIIGSF